MPKTWNVAECNSRAERRLRIVGGEIGQRGSNETKRTGAQKAGKQGASQRKKSGTSSVTCNHRVHSFLCVGKLCFFSPQEFAVGMVAATFLGNCTVTSSFVLQKLHRLATRFTRSCAERWRNVFFIILLVWPAVLTIILTGFSRFQTVLWVVVVCTLSLRHRIGRGNNNQRSQL